jgi:hypothetical protein
MMMVMMMVMVMVMVMVTVTLLPTCVLLHQGATRGVRVLLEFC